MDGTLVVRPRDGWSILFAREPEPDLEFDDLGDDIQETRSSGSPRPRPRRSSRKPIHWVLFALIVSIGGLFAYDPELAMDVFGLSTSQAPPPMTIRPVPKPRPSLPAQVAPVSPPVATVPSQPAAPATLSVSTPTSAMSGLAPLFSEGQRVVVVADPALPAENVTLSPDPSGSRSGPTIPAGAMLVVMDGELHDGSWIYSVRTAEGAIGWLPEKRLRAQR